MQKGVSGCPILKINKDDFCTRMMIAWPVLGYAVQHYNRKIKLIKLKNSKS